LEETAFPDTITEPIYTMLAYISAIFPAVAEGEADGEALVGTANAALDCGVTEAEVGVEDDSV
jgi:hypothetical protein